MNWYRSTPAQDELLAVVHGRMRRGESNFRLFFPQRILPLGRSHIHIVNFSICFAATHYHFEEPLTQAYPPLPVAYQDTIEVKVAKPQPLKIGRRITMFVPPGPEQPEPDAPVSPPLIDDVELDWTPGVGRMSPPLNPFNPAPLIDDDDDDIFGPAFKRFKRDVGDDIPPKGIKISVVLFEPFVKPADLDFNANTGFELIDEIDRFFQYWHVHTGKVHRIRPTIELRPLTLLEKIKYNDFAKNDVTLLDKLHFTILKLPPCIGLAMEKAEHFKAFGFTEGNITSNVPKRSKLRAIIGDSTTGAITVFTSTIPINPHLKGVELITKALKNIAKKGEPSSPLVKPEIICIPRVLSFTSDLSDYNMPEKKMWSLTKMLIEELLGHLSKCLAIKGSSGTDKYITFVINKTANSILGILSAKNEFLAKVDMPVTIEFGSLEFAQDWGFTKKIISFSNSVSDSIRIAPVGFITGRAYEARIDDDEEVEKNERLQISLQLGNIVSVTWRPDNKWPDYLITSKQAFNAGQAMDSSSDTSALLEEIANVTNLGDESVLEHLERVGAGANILADLANVATGGTVAPAQGAQPAREIQQQEAAGGGGQAAPAAEVIVQQQPQQPQEGAAGGQANVADVIVQQPPPPPPPPPPKAEVNVQPQQPPKKEAAAGVQQQQPQGGDVGVQQQPPAQGGGQQQQGQAGVVVQQPQQPQGGQAGVVVQQPQQPQGGQAGVVVQQPQQPQGGGGGGQPIVNAPVGGGGQAGAGAGAADDDLVELVRIPNPVPKPSDTYIFLQQREKGRCVEAVDKFPTEFYIICLQGEREQYITDLGFVSIAATFTSPAFRKGAGYYYEETLSPGCTVVNHDCESFLDFEIWSFVPKLFQHPINKTVDAFIRATVLIKSLERHSRV